MHILVSSLNNNNEVLVKGSYEDSWVQKVLKDFDYEVKSLNFELNFKKSGDFIELDGHIKASLVMDCVRCTKSFVQNIEDDFKVFIYSENGNLMSDGGELELKAEDLEFVQIQAGQIFPAEIVREQVLLMLPDYPLCNAECHCEGCIDSDREPTTINKENSFTVLDNLKL